MPTERDSSGHKMLLSLDDKKAYRAILSLLSIRGAHVNMIIYRVSLNLPGKCLYPQIIFGLALLLNSFFLLPTTFFCYDFVPDLPGKQFKFAFT